MHQRTGQAPATMDAHPAVFEGQIDYLFQQLPRLLGYSVVVAFLLAAMLWNAVPLGAIAIWVSAMLLILLVRLALYFRYRRKAETSPPRHWARWHVLLAGASGLVWGAATGPVLPAKRRPRSRFWVLADADPGFESRAPTTSSPDRHAAPRGRYDLFEQRSPKMARRIHAVMQNPHNSNAVSFLAVKEQVLFTGKDDQALVKVLSGLSKIRGLGKSCCQVFQPVDIFDSLGRAPGRKRIVNDGRKVALGLFGKLINRHQGRAFSSAASRLCPPRRDQP